MKIIAVVLLLLVVGCAKQQIANPASQYCEEHNGKLEIRDSPEGQTGFCILPNNTECEEWSYYRGECGG